MPQKEFVYFDYYFSTLLLLERINELNLCGTGAILANRNEVLNNLIPIKYCVTCIEHVYLFLIVIAEQKNSNKIITALYCCGIDPKEKVKC